MILRKVCFGFLLSKHFFKKKTLGYPPNTNPKRAKMYFEKYSMTRYKHLKIKIKKMQKHIFGQ
jgi:hypothetical protein